MFANVLKTQLDLAHDVSPVYSPAPSGDEFVQKMTVAARLINANLGFRVLDLGLDGFDTHDDQPGRHPDLLTQLDTGLATFFSTLDPAYYNRVTVMTMSEFGRTPYSNDSAGTDHGTANVHVRDGPERQGWALRPAVVVRHDQQPVGPLGDDHRLPPRARHGDRRVDGWRGVDHPQRAVPEPRVLPGRAR